MDSVLQIIPLLLVAALLTHDDVVLVAFAVSEINPATRRQIILFGIISAVLLRLALAFGAIVATGQLSALIARNTDLTPERALAVSLGGSMIGIAVLVGLLRLWRSWRVYRSITKEPVHRDSNSFWWPLVAVVFAEFASAIEVVVFMAGLSGGSWSLFSAGIALTILLKAFASEIVTSIFDRYPWIAWIGLLIVLWVALDMIYVGSHEMACEAFNFGCSESFWQAVVHRLGLN